MLRVPVWLCVTGWWLGSVGSLAWYMTGAVHVVVWCRSGIIFGVVYNFYANPDVNQVRAGSTKHACMGEYQAGSGRSCVAVLHGPCAVCEGLRCDRGLLCMVCMVCMVCCVLCAVHLRCDRGPWALWTAGSGYVLCAPML